MTTKPAKRDLTGPFFLIGGGVLVVAVLLAFFFSHLEEKTLAPRVSCTKIACPEDNPCCNDCIHEGWRVERPVHAEARGFFSDLPRYKADGCGVVAKSIKARGMQIESKFYVFFSEQVPAK